MITGGQGGQQAPADRGLGRCGGLQRFGQAGTRRNWIFWLAAGCLVHTALDIPTHVTDGPLLLFPFEWSLRFRSPLSYWDSAYFGREFTMFELLLNVALLAYLFGPGLWGRLRRV